MRQKVFVAIAVLLFGAGFDVLVPDWPDRWNRSPERILPDLTRWQEQRNIRTSIIDTNTVGCFPGGRSGYAVQDLSGNVTEWTRSLWGKDPSTPEFKYPFKPEDGREALKAGNDVLRVVRGGAFNFDDGDLRAAYRSGFWPDNRYGNFGFRVVVSPSFSGL